MDEDFDDYDDEYGWLYAEDEYDLADELAENQVPEPGYSGTNHEIAMETYEFELYGFWEDLEYADDAYWDTGPSIKDDNPAGGKRKREAGKKAVTDKRRKTHVENVAYDREEDPLLFVSQESRLRSFFEPPPLLKTSVKYSFLADWRERFAHESGAMETRVMPVDMKRAAEATTLETPPKVRAVDVTEMDVEGEEEDGDWEDDEDDGEEGEDNGPGLDPGMLQEILKQKLGEAGLGGEDEAAFMQVIAKMMSGEGDADDAAGELTTTLLSKLTSGTGGDSALSGWLSQQGVQLEGDDDDDAASVATAELPEDHKLRGLSGLSTQQSAQDSPIDSVVGEAQKRTSSQMPLLSSSPAKTSTPAKKRTAVTMGEHENPNKKQKKVTFDVPSSSSSDLQTQPASDLLTSEDPLMSETMLRKGPSLVQEHAQVTKEAPTKRSTRKRKAADAEVMEEKPPKKKQTRKQEMETSEAAASPMGPPARRTRAAKAKAGK